MFEDDECESLMSCVNSWMSSAFKVQFFISCDSSQIIFLFSQLMSVSLQWNWVFILMKKEININSEESEKLFRNLIKNLRRRAADEMMKSEMMTESDQKKIRWSRDELYIINYETQVQRWKINGAAITTERIEWWWKKTREFSLSK